MFSVGQRVWHRGTARGFTVLECDGDRVYLVQDNGAEIDFLARDLTAVAPEGGGALAATAHERAKSAARPGTVRTLTARDITPDHVRVLAAIPVRTLQAVAARYESRSAGVRFSALDTAAKLNFVTSVTAVPYLTMKAYSDRPGELGLLMGKGLSDSA